MTGRDQNHSPIIEIVYLTPHKEREDKIPFLKHLTTIKKKVVNHLSSGHLVDPDLQRQNSQNGDI